MSKNTKHSLQIQRYQQKYLEKQNRKSKYYFSSFTSGIFLGLSILTKIPVFTMIPLVGYLICMNTNTNQSNNNQNNSHRNIDVKKLGIWFIPLILIPLIWPIYSILTDDFDLWLKDIMWNMQREYYYDDRPIASSLLNSLDYIFQIDPIIFLLGCVSIIFSYIKRDFSRTFHGLLLLLDYFFPYN